MWFSGKVSILEDAALDSFRSKISQQAASNNGDLKMKLTALDIYKELRLRGYDYGKTFQGILESNNAGNSAVNDVTVFVCTGHREHWDPSMVKVEEHPQADCGGLLNVMYVII